jgi:hypothetical protein
MIRALVNEAAALASLSLFAATILVWAQMLGAVRF